LINLIISEKASNLLQDKSKKFVKHENKDNIALVIYRYFTRSWYGTSCSDVVQLIQKHKITRNPYFEKWREINIGNTGFEIFIDKNLKDDLESNSKNIKIHARTWKLFGKLRGSLSLKIENL